MKAVRIGRVRPFPGVRPTKGQALKVLEEAAEVFGGWQAWEDDLDPCMREYVLCETADCITACANLAAAMGVHDLRPYIEMARVKNEERGRYE